MLKNWVDTNTLKNSELLSLYNNLADSKNSELIPAISVKSEP